MKVGSKVRSKMGSIVGEVGGVITKIVEGWNGNLYAEIEGSFYPVRLLEEEVEGEQN